MADLTQVYDALRKADAAGDTAGAQKLAAYIREQQTAAPAPEPEKPATTATDVAAAIPETALHLATGAVATPLAGLAGLGTMAGRALGLTKADPADVVRSTQDALTYAPRTHGGQAVSDAVGYLPGKFAGMADAAGAKVADVTGSPALGAAANTAIQGAPMLLGAKLPLGRAAAPAAVAPEVAEATGAGLRLTPEQGGGGFVARAAQSLSGSAKLERSLSKTNAPVLNDLAKSDIGIAPTQPLNAATVKQAKTAPNSVYAAVSKVGNVPTDAQFASDIGNVSNRTGSGSFSFDVPPSVDRLKAGYGGLQAFDAADAVAKVRQLRKDSGRNIKSPDPEQNALGYAQKQVAEAIDDQLDRHIQALGTKPGSGIAPNLIDQLRGARVQLAKIHSVEDALDGSNLSAKAIAKQKDRGVPLSGNLLKIANAYQNFDRSLQDVSKIRDGGPFGVLDLGFGAAAGLAHPAALSAVIARPLARAALASKGYQRLGIQRQPLTGAPAFPGLIGAGAALPAVTAQQQPQGLLNYQP